MHGCEVDEGHGYSGHYPTALSGNATTLQILDGLVKVQAAMISCIDDFQLMMWVKLLAMPLALIPRRPARA